MGRSGGLVYCSTTELGKKAQANPTLLQGLLLLLLLLFLLLCFGFILRVFQQSVGESYLFHPINSSDYPHDPSVSEPSRLLGNSLQ